MSKASAIILAGGLGTRLRTVVSDIPKCMAPINGIPFIRFVIDHFRKQGITSFIFSVGYLHEVIINYVNTIPGITSEFCVETEPLGTGGAISEACKLVKNPHAIICNGDTLFKINAEKLLEFHLTQCAECTLSLKPMHNFDRYGVVELNPDLSVKSFKEKMWYDDGLINGGVYALDCKSFSEKGWQLKFSFEKEYLEKYVNSHAFYAIVQDEYFIDIGIPEDYSRAQLELSV